MAHREQYGDTVRMMELFWDESLDGAHCAGELTCRSGRRGLRGQLMQPGTGLGLGVQLVGLLTAIAEKAFVTVPALYTPPGAVAEVFLMMRLSLRLTVEPTPL
ncbi:hypothetical protein ACH4E7_44930 [Kitasatospora sp. NPDC018058]|uniref:hypothetical protein n=1 Tax=Kitasatospora sp. NPDC018058 TaxID=3364025 RepID=UPI0037BEB84C